MSNNTPSSPEVNLGPDPYAHDPVQRLLAALTRGGYDPRPAGAGKYESRCPAHKGSRRNLSVTEGADGAALVRCHHIGDDGRNCPASAIVAELGLEMKDLFRPLPGSNGKARKKPPKPKAAAPAPANATPKRPANGFDSPRDAAEFLGRKLKAAPSGHWVYRDTEGNAVAAVYRFDTEGGKEYRPVSLDPETGLWVIRDPPGLWPLYRPAELATAPCVYLFEGEKCVDLARSLGLVATTTAHGAQSPHKTDFRPLAGKQLVIVPDYDPPGEGYAAALLKLLAKLDPRPSVKVLRLPGLAAEGDDIEQWAALRPGVQPEALRAELEQLAEGCPAEDLGGNGSGPRVGAGAAAGGGNLPHIICGTEDPAEGLKTWSPAAMEALRAYNDPPRLFQRGHKLTRIRPADDDAPPTLGPLCLDALRGELDRAAAWGEVVVNRKGEKRVKFGPPRIDVVRDIACLPGWDPEVIPKLEMIVETPRFLPDGSLLQTPGYHADARVFYAPAPGLENLDVPSHPMTDDVLAARSLILDDLLVDFTFANQASRAAAVAFTLLPFVRGLISGPTPLHHVTASTEGTGKTLLIIACTYPSLGRELNLSPQKESEAEWRKALTTVFLSGASHFCMDNLYNPIGWDDTPLPVDSGTLAMALTAPFYTDRKLGGNEDARVKIQTVFASTGNNVMFSRELTRRLVPIELVASVENPSLRTGFKHDPLLEGFVEPRRRDLLRACLTLCRFWIAEGRPMGSEVMGMYSSYARTMGGILKAIDVPGFLANRTTLIGRNTESTRWAALINEWARIHQQGVVTSSDLHKVILGNSDLHVAFSDILGDKGELSQKQKLGKSLEKQINQVWGEWRVTRSGARARNGSAIYRLKPASDPYIEAVDDTEGDDGNAVTCFVGEDCSAF